MPKLRVLGAATVIKFLESQGFFVDRQKGSHVVLIRKISVGRQILTIPNHYEIDRGTVKGIYNQCKKYIRESDLKKFFYA